MNLDAQTVLIIGVLFCSTFIRSSFGFGDALLAMPILAIILDLKIATPLVAMIASTIAILLIIRRWREIQFKSVWRLIISSAAGIPLGLYYLKGAFDQEMKIVLAVIIILFSIYSILKIKPYHLRTEKMSYFFGLFAGVLGGAYNTNGPPVVIYGALRNWAPNSFRATLQGYFLLSGSFITLGHAMAGLWTTTVIRLYGYSFPLVILAIFAGDKVGASIPQGKFDNFVHGLLILAGLLLLVQTLAY